MSGIQKNTTSHRGRGFTLIELIGVLAIMAILAAAVAPNALKSIEAAALKAENQSLQDFGELTRSYVQTYHALPPTNTNPASGSTWYSTLGLFGSMASADILANRRGFNRVYLVDPATPSTRVMILSVMRPGLSLPSPANINTAARFDALWQTPQRTLPSTASWTGWSAWTAVTDSEDYLGIQRINLVNDLKTYAVSLNQRGTAAARYQVTLANGTRQAAVTINAGASVTLTSLYARDRIDLYATTSATSPNYTYVVSDSGRVIDFDGTNWIAR